MNAPPQRRVAIVGGGLSGLATAVQLQLADSSIDLTLFESSPQLGGVIQTVRENGFVVDLGSDMFATNPPAAMRLIERLGLTNRLVEPCQGRRGARIVHRGRLVPVPEGFVLMRATRLRSVLASPLLSWRGKLRLLAEPLISPRGERAKVDSNAELAECDDESVASFVRRRMGDEVLQRIVAPLTAGIYTADVERLSMNATMKPIADMERQHGSLAKATLARRRSGEDAVERISTGARYGQFRAFRDGMGELIDHLSKRIGAQRIRPSTPIASLHRQDAQWIVETAGGQSERFDGVVVATPSAPAARLIEPFCTVAAEQLRSIESASTAIVVLGVDRSQIAGDIEMFGFVVPKIEQRKILAASFSSHKFPGRAPDGKVLIRVFIGGALQSELVDWDDEQLLQVARSELEELIGLTGKPSLARVLRWRNAMPQYHVGHEARVARIQHDIDQTDGLWLVNNALDGVGIAPLIGLAEKTAQQIATHFASSGCATQSDGLQG